MKKIFVNISNAVEYMFGSAWDVENIQNIKKFTQHTQTKITTKISNEIFIFLIIIRYNLQLITSLHSNSNNKAKQNKKKTLNT